MGQTDRYPVTEFHITYPHSAQTSAAPAEDDDAAPGSTHEITFNRYETNPQTLFITNQNDNTLVKMALDGSYQLVPMPAGSGPHGMAITKSGKLWLTLEFVHELVQVDENGKIARTVDLDKACPGCGGGRMPGPHGLNVGPDGESIWFTGKEGAYVGTVRADGSTVAYPLPDADSFPIYILAGPDGNMWFTELTGNKIGRVTMDGTISEFDVPTPNSRPIALVAGPDGKSMWFTEEAGNRIGHIDVANGKITEYEVPKSQANLILAALAFDGSGNLWVQQYVNQNKPSPAGPDKLIRIDNSFMREPTPTIPPAAITIVPVPSQKTVMHRVIEGPDHNIWFTELGTNTVGRVTIGR